MKCFRLWNYFSKLVVLDSGSFALRIAGAGEFVKTLASNSLTKITRIEHASGRFWCTKIIFHDVAGPTTRDSFADTEPRSYPQRNNNRNNFRKVFGYLRFWFQFLALEHLGLDFVGHPVNYRSCVDSITHTRHLTKTSKPSSIGLLTKIHTPTVQHRLMSWRGYVSYPQC